MSLQEQEFGTKLGRHLDAGAADLRPGIAYRLQQARAAALDKLAEREQTAASAVVASSGRLAGAGGAAVSGGRGGRSLFAQPRLWVGILLIAAAGYGLQQWLAWQELEEIEDLDAKLLSSDLPIDAYLDRDFMQWLKSADANR
jgi:hypothetical protein